MRKYIDFANLSIIENTNWRFSIVRLFNSLILITILSIFILQGTAFTVGRSTDENSSGFRGVSWGMSEEQVKATEENAPLEESNNVLYYSYTASGLNDTIGYFFYEHKLFMATYMYGYYFGQEALNTYIQTYKDLMSDMSEDYGEPLGDIKYDNIHYDNLQDAFYFTIMRQTFVATEWETNKSHIILKAIGGNYYGDNVGMLLTVFYDKKYTNEEIGNLYNKYIRGN